MRHTASSLFSCHQPSTPTPQPCVRERVKPSCGHSAASTCCLYARIRSCALCRRIPHRTRFPPSHTTVHDSCLNRPHPSIMCDLTRGHPRHELWCLEACFLCLSVFRGLLPMPFGVYRLASYASRPLACPRETSLLPCPFPSGQRMRSPHLHCATLSTRKPALALPSARRLARARPLPPFTTHRHTTRMHMSPELV